MFKKLLVSATLSACLVSGLHADKISKEMEILTKSLVSAQNAFLQNDRSKSIRLLADLKINIHKVLGSEKKVNALLPKKLSDKKQIGLNSGRIINERIDEIQAIYFDDSISALQAQVNSQEKMLDIQRQCYKCHNLVRDWEENRTRG